MKKRKGLYSWLTALLLISVIVSGCSNADEGKVGTATHGTGGNEGKKVEILLGYNSRDSSYTKMKELIEQLEKQHPNIKVKTQSAPYGQFYQKLDTQIAAGQAPDVWLS
ncbi:extracellular solute-binding protein, partial [Clostridium perfringens]